MCVANLQIAIRDSKRMSGFNKCPRHWREYTKLAGHSVHHPPQHFSTTWPLDGRWWGRLIELFLPAKKSKHITLAYLNIIWLHPCSCSINESRQAPFAM